MLSHGVELSVPLNCNMLVGNKLGGEMVALGAEILS